MAGRSLPKPPFDVPSLPSPPKPGENSLAGFTNVPPSSAEPGWEPLPQVGNTLPGGIPNPLGTTPIPDSRTNEDLARNCMGKMFDKPGGPFGLDGDGNPRKLPSARGAADKLCGDDNDILNGIGNALNIEELVSGEAFSKQLSSLNNVFSGASDGASSGLLDSMKDKMNSAMKSASSSIMDSANSMMTCLIDDFAKSSIDCIKAKTSNGVTQLNARDEYIQNQLDNLGSNNSIQGSDRQLLADYYGEQYDAGLPNAEATQNVQDNLAGNMAAEGISGMSSSIFKTMTQTVSSTTMEVFNDANFSSMPDTGGAPSFTSFSDLPIIRNATNANNSIGSMASGMLCDTFKIGGSLLDSALGNGTDINIPLSLNGQTHLGGDISSCVNQGIKNVTDKANNSFNGLMPTNPCAQFLISMALSKGSLMDRFCSPSKQLSLQIPEFLIDIPDIMFDISANFHLGIKGLNADGICDLVNKLKSGEKLLDINISLKKAHDSYVNFVLVYNTNLLQGLSIREASYLQPALDTMNRHCTEYNNVMTLYAKFELENNIDICDKSLWIIHTTKFDMNPMRIGNFYSDAVVRVKKCITLNKNGKPSFDANGKLITFDCPDLIVPRPYVQITASDICAVMTGKHKRSFYNDYYIRYCDSISYPS